eukprot:CAMPEP_0195635538 /NCGR_PEP_ID=MMETSP0815-20121206/23335_1 /TAXON_ID=97485 /ORGANISM="Prymnesium parvum, Strain Texoma1" /LENGTH=54 /DNA_ID=CAMNT_0040777479 /DNA_START=88 /DNA_END=252 /DNA_ORIENTATION=+
MVLFGLLQCEVSAYCSSLSHFKVDGSSMGETLAVSVGLKKNGTDKRADGPESTR